MTEKGDKGDANEAVIKALIAAGNLLARGKLKHQYPHSWRSKKPVIFRNTPQWFIAMDQYMEAPHAPTLRSLALSEIARTHWVPAAGENRITGMIANRPDWVVSRQRAWGVPIALFVEKGTHKPFIDAKVNARIVDAFRKEGADAWFEEGAAKRFLAPDHDPAQFEKITDVLDVWFDSGCTHAFALEDPQAFPSLADIRRKRDGGEDEIMYLEGSDQHRGWFHSSLLESCGTRGRAPYDIVSTHGFVLDEKGRKMSKSLGNVVAPQNVIKRGRRRHPAAVGRARRLHRRPAHRPGNPEIRHRHLSQAAQHHPLDARHARALRAAMHIDFDHAPELERLMLHRLVELDENVRRAYAGYDYKKVVALLTPFMISDLSAFYFDIRKDALYCDPPSSVKRKAALATIEQIFRCVTTWLAPILVFTSEEAWLSRYGDAISVHLELFPDVPSHWRDDALAQKWDEVRAIRAVVTGALELQRAQKRIGSSLEAAPIVHIAEPHLLMALDGIDFAEVSITSGLRIETSAPPQDAFQLPEVKGVAVSFAPAPGVKCQRSWKYFDPATAEPDYPDVTPRDAQALRELIEIGAWKPQTDALAG